MRLISNETVTLARGGLLPALPVAVVAAFAGIVSYSHIYRLAVATGQTGTAARLMPLSVDCLIVAGSVILYQTGPGQQWLGWLGVVPGVGATLFANVESGISHGWLAAMVDGWPALAFSLATFMLERWLRGHVVSAVASSGQCPHQVARTAEEAVVQSYLHVRDCLGEVPSQRQLSAGFGLSRPKVAELVGALNGHHTEREATA